ncbi:MAG: TonB-dependent receptor [Rubricoccaceae bacterium]
MSPFVQRLAFSLTASLLSLALLPAALAQPTGMPRLASVTGTVVAGDTGEPLPSATVAAYQDDAFVTGASTNLEGAFTLELRPGTYQIRVSFVGYETQRREDYEVSAGPPASFGVVELALSTESLDAAEITARREFVEQQADRTIYNVKEQPVTAGGSVLETLQTLPSVEVDTDGNISLQGNQNVVIQINGRPTPVSGAFLAALLRQINSENVDRVEVLPNPSAKFEADGMGGIINIVLSEGTDRGLSGGLTLGGGTNPEGNIGANLSYQKGTWDLNGSYGFRYGQRDGDRESEFFSRLLDIDQTGINEDVSQSHFFNGSAAYIIGEGTDLTLEGSFGVRGSDNLGSTDFLNLQRFADPTQSDSSFATLRRNDDDSDGLNGDLALIYRKKFQGANGGRAGAPGGPGGMGGFRGRFGGPRGGTGTSSSHELAVEARVTRNRNDRLGEFEDFDILDAVEALADRQRESTDQTNTEVSFQVDYTRPLGQAKLETGIRLSDERVGNDFRYERFDGTEFIEDTGRTNAFDYDRQIGAAYAQVASPLGPFQVQAGVRMEAAQRNFDLLTDVPELAIFDQLDLDNTEASYADLFPSAFVTLPIGDAQQGTLVKASYRRSINRPRTFFLNPFPSFQDTTFVRVGNPGLTPEYTDKVDVSFTYKYFFTVSPFFSRTTDVISRRLFFQDGVRLFSAENLDTETSYGADVNIGTSLAGGDVRGFLNGSVFQEVLAEQNENTVDGLSWRLSANITGTIREGTNVQMFYFYRGPSNTLNGRRYGFGFGSIGVNQTITDQLRLAVRLNDPFRTGRFRFDSEFQNPDGSMTTTETRFDTNSQQISATLTWTFGSNQNRRQRQQQDDGGMGGDGFGI